MTIGTDALCGNWTSEVDARGAVPYFAIYPLGPIFARQSKSHRIVVRPHPFGFGAVSICRPWTVFSSILNLEFLKLGIVAEVK